MQIIKSIITMLGHFLRKARWNKRLNNEISPKDMHDEQTGNHKWHKKIGQFK